MSWLVTRVEQGVVHVHPLADIVAHDLDPDCPCMPTPELAPSASDGDGWIHVHHSLDDREARE